MEIILIFLAEIVPIKEVRRIDSNGNPVHLGETVEVTGIVTVAYEFGSKGPAFVQDTSAGIALYGTSLGNYSIKIGDSVTVKGMVDIYKGLIEIQDPEIIVHSSGHEVVSTVITISEMGKIEDSVEVYEGMLVKIENVEILASGVFESAEYTIKDETGTGNLWIYWTQDDIMGKPIPKGKIKIKGVISQYDAEVPYLEHYQLIPRVWEDFDTTTGGGGEEEIIPIGRLYEDTTYIGQVVKITGIITAGTGIFSKDRLDCYVQDTSGGINLFSFTVSTTLEEGDSIVAEGVVQEYKGKLEIKDPVIEVVAHDRPLPSPLIITSKELNQERYEGMLVEITGIKVEGDVFGTGTYEFTDAYGNGVIWIDPDTDIPGLEIPKDTFSLIGIKSQYDTLPPYTEGYQIMPRKREDFIFTHKEVPLITIGEVQSPGDDGYSSKYKGKAVRVRGYIISPKYVFSEEGYDKMFIQDSTGGICLYKIVSVKGDSSYLDSLFYEVECTGVVDEYKGLTEITNCVVKITGHKKEIIPETLGFNVYLNESMESKLVTLYGVNPVAEPDVDSRGYNLFFKNGTPVITVRIDSVTHVKIDSLDKELCYNITGIVSQYDVEEPYNTGYQLLLRFPSDIKSFNTSAGEEVEIKEISPNPFSPDLEERLKITVNIPQEYVGSLYIYNLKGKKIKTIFENSGAGENTVFWDGKDDRGGKVMIGIYVLVLKAKHRDGKIIEIKKPIVVGSPLR